LDARTKPWAAGTASSIYISFGKYFGLNPRLPRRRMETKQKRDQRPPDLACWLLVTNRVLCPHMISRADYRRPPLLRTPLFPQSVNDTYVHTIRTGAHIPRTGNGLWWPLSRYQGKGVPRPPARAIPRWRAGTLRVDPLLVVGFEAGFGNAIRSYDDPRPGVSLLEPA
jgi:hypothetical protein